MRHVDHVPRSLVVAVALLTATSWAGGQDAPPPGERRSLFERLHAGGQAPDALGEPLDPRFVELGEVVREQSRADWRRRLEARRGRASLVPWGRFEAVRPLLVLVPGNGMNFQDVHALVRLEDTYQIVVAISDHRRKCADGAAEVAEAIADLIPHRNMIRHRMGLGQDPTMRVVGHSFGSASALHALEDLVAAGHLGAGRAIERVLHVSIDGPWRGADLPWFATLPGVKQAFSWVLGHVPPFSRRANAGNLSFINRTRSMEGFRRIRLGQEVSLHLVAVIGPAQTSRRWRHVEPVQSWFSGELGSGEIERLWVYYREGATDRRRLGLWSTPLVTRKQGLENLVIALEREADYVGHAAELIAAARASATVAEFAPRYDEVLGRIVDAFDGQHTRFMWEDPRFMPWLRETLARGW